MDVETWLRRLGLGQYKQAFHENDIDARVLPGLTADDLKEIGVASVGHRRLMLQAVAALSAAPADPVTTAVEATGARSIPGRAAPAHGACSSTWSARPRCVGRLDPEEMRSVLPRLPERRRRRGHALRRPCGQAHGRWRAGLLRLAQGARGRGRACCAGRPGDRRGGRPARHPAGSSRSRRGSGSRPASWSSASCVGEGAAREEAVVGETPNLAARLQASGRARRGGGRGRHAPAPRRGLRSARRSARPGSRASPARWRASASWASGPRTAGSRPAGRAACRPWSGANRSWRSCSSAGGGPRPARARRCSWSARPGSASRGWSGPLLDAARRATSTRHFATSARPTTPTRRSGR